MEYVLLTKNLTKRYGQLEAISHVNLHISPGDIYGLIGSNGAGKTTIIRVITGLAHPTEGSYRLFGTDFDDPDIYQARRRVSAIVETPSLHQNLSAYDNLLIQCQQLGVVDCSIIEEILDVVGLGYLRHQPKKVKHFSMGMKQRLGIALTLIGNPDFILLDEPMNGLDPEGIVEIRELILRLNQERNITFLISSHILGELSKIATKYGFIHHGNLIKEISARQLQEECRKSTELTVDNVKKAAQVLETELNITNYRILNEAIVRIYDEIDITLVVTYFARAGILIRKIHNRDESIEEYYLNLMGGLRDA